MALSEGHLTDLWIVDALLPGPGRLWYWMLSDRVLFFSLDFVS